MTEIINCPSDWSLARTENSDNLIYKQKLHPIGIQLFLQDYFVFSIFVDDLGRDLS
jgi:hypothetical protein